ncbi:MAG: zinc ribbon domain-containing protein [Chloroflexi bacterium]|nr:zinc ribbon domain-containing protein [Chloroflexota bacterium]
MPYCTSCGTEVLAGARFCQSCGSALATLVLKRVEGYRISPNRIVVMSILSWSLYLFYWMYLTWKHYRDHTGEVAYPVWHAMAVAVPIYGYFRVHAHARSFKELMTDAGVETTINPGRVVLWVIVYSVLSGIENWLPYSGGISQGVAFVITIIDIISVVIVIGILQHLQKNLNQYWDSVAGSPVASTRIGVGEVVLAVLGVLAWADTLAMLLSSGYRTL